jgi:hypothetical protein
MTINVAGQPRGPAQQRSLVAGAWVLAAQEVCRGQEACQLRKHVAAQGSHVGGALVTGLKSLALGTERSGGMDLSHRYQPRKRSVRR